MPGESTQLFFESLFQGILPTEFIELRLIQECEEDVKPYQIFFYNEIDKFLDKVSQVAPPWHCYFGVAPRCRKSGTKQDIERMLCLWADVDADNFKDDMDAALAAAKSFPLPASYIINTGHGYHLYWLLDTACMPAEGSETMLRIRDIIQGDNVADSARIMRVPETINCKREPFVTAKVEQCRSEYRYTLRDLVAATQVSKEVRTTISTGEIPKKAKDQSRSGRDWHVILHLKRTGMSEGAIKIIFAEQPVGDKYRAEGDHYLDQTVSKAGKAIDQLASSTTYIREYDDRYVAAGRAGQVAISTFVLDPKRLLHGEREDSFLCNVRSEGIIWPSLSIPKRAFLSVASLSSHLGRVNWQWLGSDKDVRYLLPHLITRWKDFGGDVASATSVIGRHNDLWVGPDGTLSATSEYTRETGPVVYEDPGRVHPETAFLHVEYPEGIDAPSFMHQLNAMLPQINMPHTIWPIIGWFCAAPFKPLLNAADIRFPHLELFGTKGSGKSSTLLKVMLRLAGYTKPMAHDCRTTAFVLLSLLSSTNAVPVSLSEFRRSTLADKEYGQLKRMLLLSYDSAQDARGNFDQTTREYDLLAPLVLDGEDMIDDAAIHERTVVVRMDPQVIEVGGPAWTTFNDLVNLPLERFATEYVQFSLEFTQDAVFEMWSAAYDEVRAVFDTVREDRIVRNMATALMGIRMYQRFMQRYGVTTAEIAPIIFERSLSEIRNEKIGRSGVMADEFVVDVVNEVAVNASRAGFLYVYHSTDNILWFHMTSTASWWYEHRRRQGRASLESNALRIQLSEREITRSGIAGQYVLPPRAVRTGGQVARMFGLDLTAMNEMGMDIPQKLNKSKSSIVVIKPKSNGDSPDDSVLEEESTEPEIIIKRSSQ